MNYLTKARSVIKLEIQALERVQKRLGNEFNRAIEELLRCVQSNHKIIATGIGKSGHIAEKIAATLTSTGAPCVYLNCVNAVHGDLGIVSDGDCILIFSYSGETEEIIRTLPALTRPDVCRISLTGNSRSTLARHSDVHLDIQVKREACPLNLAPTASTTAMLAVGDALAMVLLEARGFKKDDFAKYHPGGVIGKSLLLKVTDVMRAKNHLAMVTENDSVFLAIQAMSQARAGAAIVVKKSGTLAGIFTHGDFARHYQKDHKIGSQKVQSVMTKHPITVQHKRLAIEALRIFEEYQIDDLVVIDTKGVPIGLIDAQDLAKHRLV